MDPVAVTVENLGLLQVLQQGGFIMYPLGIFSILTWGVAIYKLVALKAFSREYKNIYKEVSTLMANNKSDQMHEAFKKCSRAISNAHEPLFDDNLHEREDYNEKLNRRLESANSDLRKGLWILGTIASSAPFVGLFGTVVGIMTSFHSMGNAGGKGGFAVVSAGISESLVATATGIIIAVIALLFFNYFQIYVQGIFHDFKNKVEDLAQSIFIARRRAEGGQVLQLVKAPPAEPVTMANKMKAILKHKEVANGR